MHKRGEKEIVICRRKTEGNLETSKKGGRKEVRSGGINKERRADKLSKV
jgi:hypothetical protein